MRWIGDYLTGSICDFELIIFISEPFCKPLKCGTCVTEPIVYCMDSNFELKAMKILLGG